MKQYKHKITGFIATETNSGKNFKVNNPQNFTIPSWIIEKGEDWEEIVKNFLFITEDGKEIFEGDEWFSIHIEYNSGLVFMEPFTIVIGNLKTLDLNNKYVKRFSTREAAENYIICNKPCLSFNDVWNISNNKSSDNYYVIIDKRKLKEFVKSKL
jgi:hypothetical protein